MKSTEIHTIEQNSGDDLKSQSTIQIEFSDSITQKFTKTHNHNRNSSSSFERCFSRKRCSSRESQQMIDKEDNMNKKSRNPNESLAFSDIGQNQQIKSFSESNDSSNLQTRTRQNKEYSIQNNCENHLAWFRDFMQQSLNVIRDTVLQACLTALSTRPLTPFSSNITTRDINVNNNPNCRIQSEHSLTLENLMNHRDDNHSNTPPIIKQKDKVLLYNHRVDNDEDDDDEMGIYKKQRIHQRARTNPYLMYKNVLRTKLKDCQVPWSFECPQYKPMTFTAEEVYINPGADPDLLKSSSSICLHFNAIDGAVDRRSVYQSYFIRENDGLPLNPIGRTGLQGRGVLLRWGPNIYHYVIICRWKRDIHGNILIHPSNGKKILEILLEIQMDDSESHSFILTGGLRMIGSGFPPQLQDRLKRFTIHTGILLNNRKSISSSLTALKHLFEQSPTPWKGAYFDDARNTDNAWIELSIEYLLDNDYQLTSCIPCLNHQQLKYLEQPRFIWKDVESTMDIGPRTHYRLVKNLANKLDAYF